jgi:hypothetical protein
MPNKQGLTIQEMFFNLRHSRPWLEIQKHMRGKIESMRTIARQMPRRTPAERENRNYHLDEAETWEEVLNYMINLVDQTGTKGPKK